MTIPVFRAVSALATYGSNNAAIAKPAGVVSGDVLIAIITLGAKASTTWETGSRVPAGWVKLQEDPNTNVFTTQTTIFYKVAGGSEPASYAFDFGNQGGSAAILAYSGVSTTTPINASAQLVNTPASTSYTAPSITTTLTDSLLLTMHARRNGSTTATYTTPSGMTARAAWANTLSGGAFDLGLAAAGATGTKVSVGTGSDESFCVSIALQAVDGAAPGPVVTGTITLDAFTLSGAFATGALSLLTGDIPLDAFALSGFLGLAPGRIDSNPFKNWTGTLLAGITIPRLTILKLSDMSTVLQLTNQTIGGSGVLTVTNAAFTPGTTYLVVATSVDGTSLGAEIYTAT